jgi:glucokinase
MFIGIDVGGTNIQCALCDESGRIFQRTKHTTPFQGTREAIIAEILQSVRTLLDMEHESQPQGIGLAVPGLVEYQYNRIAASPNMTISGVDLAAPLVDAFGCPTVLVNDCDAATQGEQWMGAARDAESAIGLFVGTGLGGGIILDKKLLRSEKFSLAEVGHVCMQMDGPLCGCGNKGCLEAICSRTAIERDLRAAMADDQPTVLRDLLDPEEPRIRSGVLREALEANDPLVQKVLGGAAEALGHACVTFRHLFDPDVFVFGGGVMEACGDFLFPIIEEGIAGDPFMKNRTLPRVVLSALGDDAGVLGAAVVAIEEAGHDPFAPGKREKKHAIPSIEVQSDGAVVGGKTFKESYYVREDGQAKRVRKKSDVEPVDSIEALTRKRLKRICRGGPWLLEIGASTENATLSPEAESFLTRRSIQWEIRTHKEAIAAHAKAGGRKALLVILDKAKN